MKNLIALVFCFLTLPLHAGLPIEKRVPVDDVFAPKGFDANDNAEVIISGHLPNLCHKNPEVTVEHKEANKIVIELKSLYYHESNPYCPPVEVPFLRSISLGVLKSGVYQIVVNPARNHRRFLGKRTVLFVDNPQTSAQDDFIYARVQYIKKFPGKNYVTLLGSNPSDCFELDDIKWISNGKDTYAVLPILKKVANICTQRMVPFAYNFQVPAELSRKSVLLHVRSMDGKSINTLYKNNQ